MQTRIPDAARTSSHPSLGGARLTSVVTPESSSSASATL